MFMLMIDGTVNSLLGVVVGVIIHLGCYYLWRAKGYWSFWQMRILLLFLTAIQHSFWWSSNLSPLFISCGVVCMIFSVLECVKSPSLSANKPEFFFIPRFVCLILLAAFFLSLAVAAIFHFIYSPHRYSQIFAHLLFLSSFIAGGILRSEKLEAARLEDPVGVSKLNYYMLLGSYSLCDTQIWGRLMAYALRYFFGEGIIRLLTDAISMLAVLGWSDFIRYRRWREY